jgi:rSAM/selenodomain-associated transferase 1
MAKAPLIGRCKTRLRNRLGLRGAARLQAYLIRDRLSEALSTGYPVEIQASPDIRHAQFLAARRRGVMVRRQFGSDLGLRMRNAQQSRAVVIIGTDCPSLKQHTLSWALEQVQNGNNVCIPAHDGGYVLIGLAKSCASLFRCVTWSSAQVMAQTWRQQRRAGLKLRLENSLHDLDTPADYRRERRSKSLPAFL